MPRTTKPLTNTEVSNAKPRDKIYDLSDGGGLQLRVKPNGSKIWQLNYFRPYTKKLTSISFGAYPAVSLAEARNMRKYAKVLLARYIDPKDSREEQRRKAESATGNTLKHVCAQWLEVKKTKLTAEHALG